MVKSNKKAEKNKDDKSKPKSAKKNIEKGSLTNLEIESTIVNDSQWKCTIFMFVLQTPNMFNSVLQNLNTLPSNFSVISKGAIVSTSTSKKTEVKSPKSSKTKDPLLKSKSNKKSDKIKSSGTNNIDTRDEELPQQNTDSFNVCLRIKRSIIKLRNTDLSVNVMLNDTNPTKNQTAQKDSLNYKRNSKEYNIRHRYVILMGFYNVLMINEMAKLLVPVTSIVSFRDGKALTNDAKMISKARTSIPENKINQGVSNKKKSTEGTLRNEYMDFLEDINKLLANQTFLEINKDLLFLNYISNNYIYNEENQNNFVYNIMSLVLSVKESWEKYEQYKNSIELIYIPEVYDTLKLEDAKLYTTMISLVPLECVNTAVMLHCIVEQVAWWHNEYWSVSVDEHSEKDTSLSAQSYIHQNQEPSSVVTCTHLENITPTIINRRDEVRLAVFHLNLPEFDFDVINTRLLTTSPIYQLWKIFPPQSLAKAKWYDYHLKKLKISTEYAPFNISIIYNTFLHHSIMNLMILNFEDILEISDDDILTNTEDNSLFNDFPYKESMYDPATQSFAQQIIYDIINKVPKLSASRHRKETMQLYNVNDVDLTLFVMHSLENFPRKTPLQEKQAFLKCQLNKLKSFLIDSELSNIYLYMLNLKQQDQLIDCMKDYELIEEMSSVTMCQSLQIAFQTFPNIYFHYFPPTDSILFWFNYTTKSDSISSSKAEGIIETLLGFRDFYKYKLKAKETFEEVFVLNMEDSLADLKWKLSKNDYSENYKPTNINKFAYNLGSLQLKVSEICKYFCSKDSSCVTVKRAKLFNDTSNITVTVIKNNTSLKYEFDPLNSKSFQQLYIRLCNKININCQLKINDHPQTPDSININYDSPLVNELSTQSLVSSPSLKLDCSFSITLESGLLVEVIQTGSDLGPFYIRQRYLAKGPTCSSIWEERSRCYFKNGTIIIFYENGTVDILYSNGTMVKCTAFEAVTTDMLGDIKVELSFENKNVKVNKNENNKAKNIDRSKANKSSSNKKTSSNKEKKKQNIKEENHIELEKKHLEEKDDVGLKTEFLRYIIQESSVTSWNGELTEFKNGKVIHKEIIHKLKMAYDHINQEFYLNRSDNWNSLFLPTNLSVTFPDGSKTETYTEDFKIVNESVANEKCNGSKNGDDWQHIITTSTNQIPFGSQGLQHDNDSFDTQNPAESDYVLVETTHIMMNHNYATIKYTNSQCEAEMILPGNITIVVDNDGMFDIDVNRTERFKLAYNHLSFEANVLSRSHQKSCTTLNFEQIDSSLSVYCETIDSFGNEFCIDNMGRTSLCLSKKDTTKTGYVCVPQNIERFFVLNRDLTGYEMIHKNQHKYFYLSNKNIIELIQLPFLNNDYVSLYIQMPIYKTKSEEYLVDSTTNQNLPTLIKRKDLLNITNTQTTIWFLPAISTVSPIKIENSNLSLLNAPKAITITKLLAIREINIDMNFLFLESITKYIHTGKEMYDKYLSFYPEEINRKEEIHELGQSFTERILGSNSYYLLDNLPLNNND